MVSIKVTPGCSHFPARYPRTWSVVMGDKKSKKDKNKASKQKNQQLEKKKEQQKAKLPAKKPA